MPQMDELTLQGILNSREANALGSENSSLSQDRQNALKRYRGDPLGDEEEGKSQVVMTDTQDAIEATLPSILRIFFAGSNVVEFEPQRQSDEEGAKQASDYINFIFTRDNNGFLAFYTAIKDALMLRTGLIKVWWDESTEISTETSEGIDEDQLAILADDTEIEIIEQSQRLIQIEGGVTAIDPETGTPIIVNPETGEPLESNVVFDVKYKRTKNKDGRIKIEAIPPEEFFIQSTAISVESADYAAHITFKTQSELISQLDSFEGITREDLENLPTSTGEIFISGEKHNRFIPDGGFLVTEDQFEDRASRLIRVVEHYINIDFDDDGIAEKRMITAFGEDNGLIAQNVTLPDGIPIIDFTPIIMPHKAIGRSLDDLTKDVADIKTAVVRQVLNNFYQSNYPQRIVNIERGGFDIDDLLSPGPNNIIDGDPAQYLQLPPTSLGSSPFNLLEFVETIKENRTGITRANQGLEADSLNKTATGISLLLSASQQRQELMVRIFAESLKRMFKLMLRIVCRHQDKERVIRLNDQWIPVDPRCWNNNMDATISVGLGSGSKEQVVNSLLNINNLQQQAMQLQGGVEGQLVGTGELFNTYSRIVESSGFQNPNTFFKDPQGAEGQFIQQLQDQIGQLTQAVQQLQTQQAPQPQQQAPQPQQGGVSPELPPEALAQAEQELLQEGALGG